MLGHCAQHLDKSETHQGPAVLGIAMIAMAEELGLEMAIRSLEHLLQYGEQNIRRAVPLALGLLCISNPKVSAVYCLQFAMPHNQVMDPSDLLQKQCMTHITQVRVDLADLYL